MPTRPTHASVVPPTAPGSGASDRHPPQPLSPPPVVGGAPLREPFGNRLRRLRVARRISQRGLALRLHCDHTLILRWENGAREPAPQDLARLARVLGVSADELLQGAVLDRGRVASSRSHGKESRARLGSRLAQRRRRASLGLWDVYLATGILGRRLRAIEAGADPSLDELRRLAAALDLSVAKILSCSILDTSRLPQRVPESTHPDSMDQAEMASDPRAELATTNGW